MKEEIIISPATVRFWESYLPRDPRLIPVDDKLRCLVKIAFANLNPPPNIRWLMMKRLQDKKVNHTPPE